MTNTATLDTSPIRKLLSKLNHEWFKKKNYFFSREGLYDKAEKKIHASFDEVDYVQVDDEKWDDVKREIVVDIELNRYCWDSFFYGSMSYGMNSHDMFPEFPIDSKDVADEIIEFINKKVVKFTDVTAIDAVIRLVVEEIKNEVVKFQQSGYDEEYNKVLDEFFTNTRKEISNEFRHIKEQIRLKKSTDSLDRTLTPEICEKIANFRLGNKKLITSVESDYSIGDALFDLLGPKSAKKTPIKLRVEDWQNQDVYYLISRLSEILTDRVSIANIERKKTLFLRKGTLFARGTYDKFRTQSLDSYIAINPNKHTIDAQLEYLFH